jgi:hypothetical protein
LSFFGTNLTIYEGLSSSSATNMLISQKKRSALIDSSDFITADIVCETLEITRAAAHNLLTQWNNEGILQRISHGTYLSAHANADRQLASIQDVAQRYGKGFCLIGPSSWQRAGWCDSVPVHIALPLKPSRADRLPQDPHVHLYPLGEKEFKSIIEKHIVRDAIGVPYLNPVTQVLWWMETDCMIPMPEPEQVHWDKVTKDHMLNEVVRQVWQKQGMNQELDLQLFYETLHIDSLLRGQDENVAITSEEQQEINSPAL